jgi:hypothetical protein
MRIDPDTCTDPVLLAAEVRRLQAVIDSESTLTDAEREAIREACDEGRWYPKDYHHIDALRTLLERKK